MEGFLLFALIIIIFLLVSIRTRQKENAQKIQKDFLSFKKELLQIKEAGISPLKKDAPLKATDEEVLQWRPYKPPVEEKPKVPEPIIPAPVIYEKEEVPAESLSYSLLKEEIKEIKKPVIPTAVPESWWQQWMRNNPDLEKFVGENLVNKIGITVLVLGIAFFVKYAIDQNWISETGRVSIGLFCGIILVGTAHFLRNSYRSFSSVIAGGGIAVFYFTISFAFHQYHLFSQTAAFVIMVVITVFAVALAVLYNKIELAVIALIGGFMAPFLVSTGSGNYIVLFSYLLILNIGILSIAYYKKWPLLNILSFLCTFFIFGAWLIKEYAFSDSFLHYKNALLFATAFYLVFLTTSLIHNLRTQKVFKAFDFSFLMLITFSYYAQGMISLSEWNSGAYQGIFTIGLGLLKLCLAWYLFKAQKGDKNLLYLLIGLTLTFISLAAPVQLHGHSITLFWSAECVLLYWLHQRSGIRIFKYSSMLLLLMMLISLLMDWSIANEKNATYLAVIYTNWQGIITNIVAIISLGLYAFLLQKKSDSNQYILGIKNAEASLMMAIAAGIILFVSCLYGVNLYFDDLKSITIPNAWHQLITYLFAVLVLWILSRMKINIKSTLSIITILACVIFYLFSNPFINSLVLGTIEKKYPPVHAGVHWVSAVLLLYLFYCLIRIFRENILSLGKPFAWLINILLLIFLSIECKHLYVILLANTSTIDIYTAQYLKAGLTIVWAIFSFAIIWLGMKFKYKTLRIISLSIFTVALLKLFLFDIRNISEGGKIAAFIMLGILLLVISFMYQRLKKIIIDNGEKTM